MIPRIFWWVLPLVLLLVEWADARPGGGQSYSGGYSGGGSSGSSGGGGGGELVYVLVRLIIAYPQVGIPVAAVVVIGYIVANRAVPDAQHWDTAPATTYRPPPDFDVIHRNDPHFSVPLFEDFAYELFSRAHKERTALAPLTPYLAPSVVNSLSSMEGETTYVLIGSMAIRSVQPFQTEQGVFFQIVLDFEANLGVRTNQKTHTQYVVEQWTLRRAANAQSKPPETIKLLGCPNCNAPFESSDQSHCNFCGQAVRGGSFGWSASSVRRLHTENRPPSLTGTVPEQGTDRPSIVHPHVDQRWVDLHHADPNNTEESIAARLRHIFEELGDAWNRQDIIAARPYVTDRLFNYLRYWIDAYQSQGLANRVDESQLLHWAYCKIDRDNYYDAITIRIWATGKDYTVSQDGKVVGGSRSRNRDYSEYWTLIRKATTRGPVKNNKECPNCGAPLEISMAGQCGHCSAFVTSGEFDWVLSKIQQDESYRG